MKKRRVRPQRTISKPSSHRPLQGEGTLQGEGNYDATRRYNAATEHFVQAGKVEEAARAAAPASPAEAEEMKEAERFGLSRARGIEKSPKAIVDAADAAEAAMETPPASGRAKPRPAMRSSKR